MMIADHCVLYRSGKSWDEIHHDLQESLDIYIKWGKEHNLTLNAKKKEGYDSL